MCCACQAREAVEEAFLSPFLWCIFAVAKGFTERRDLLGTLFFWVFSQVIPARYQGTKEGRHAGIMPAHPWKCPSHRKDFRTVMHISTTFEQVLRRSPSTQKGC